MILQCFKPQKNDGHEISLLDGKLVSVATCSLGEEGQLILITDQTQTRALQDKLNQHKRLSEMGQMVASLAHQIRTPLAAAMLYAGNLKKAQQQPSLIDKFSDRIQNRLSHIEQQIRDMLIFVRGDIQINEFISISYLADLLMQTAQDIQINRECSVIVHFANSEDDQQNQLRCNQDSLISALENLINNAIDENGVGCEVMITMECISNQLIIKVQDNGTGIEKDLLDNIFEPFFTTKAQGTGLGLAVVKAIVDAHNGSINVQNLDQGCEFIINLPFSEK